MQIIASKVVADKLAQVDGRRWVYETHILDTGEVKEYVYLAEIELDYNSVMAERAAAITLELNQVIEE